MIFLNLVGQQLVRVEFANSMRGVAALFVMMAHYFGVFWFLPDVAASQAKFPALIGLQVPTYVAFFIQPWVNWGELGVGLFFIISGFVIPFSLRKTSGVTFLVGRAFRLFPTYFAGFSVVLLALWFSVTSWGIEWPYRWDEVLVHYFPGARDLYWSASIDGVIWTLEIEVKFYLVCALAASLLRRQSVWVFAIPFGLFVLSMWLFSAMPQFMAIGGYWYSLPYTAAKNGHFIIYMFIGVALHYSHIGRLKPNALVVLISLFLGMFILLWQASPDGGDGVPWSYVYALMLFVSASLVPDRYIAIRPLSFLADISYPLYCCHLIVGYVIMRILAEYAVPPYACIAAAVALSMSIAWLIHEYVELPSQRMGKAVMTRLSARAPTAIPA